MTERHPFLVDALMIAHKPSGECIYLKKDCRTIARRLTIEEARQMHLTGRLDFRVWDRGRVLLERR